jgi:hypothetical protein
MRIRAFNTRTNVTPPGRLFLASARQLILQLPEFIELAVSRQFRLLRPRLRFANHPHTRVAHDLF